MLNSLWKILKIENEYNFQSVIFNFKLIKI